MNMFTNLFGSAPVAHDGAGIMNAVAKQTVDAPPTSGEQRKDAAAKAPGNAMNDMFMKLLVAQIKNQDPLNPTDGTEYVSQLAQLSQVQATDKMANIMGQSAVLIGNLLTLSAGNLVGEKIMVNTDTIDSDGTTAVKGRITLQHPCNNATIIVKDATGHEEKITLGKQAKGSVEFTIDPQQLKLAPGKHTLSVLTDSGEKQIEIEVGGEVTSVRIPPDGSPLQINIKGIGETAYSHISQFGSTPKARRA